MVKQCWQAASHGGRRRHFSKFHADWSNHCKNMAIFPIFQDNGRQPSWFLKSGNVSCYYSSHDQCTSSWQISSISQVIAEIWQLLHLKNGSHPPSWTCYTHIVHPRRVFGLCHCAKFGWIRCSSFDNMQLLIFCMLGLKMTIHTLKIGAL